MTDVINKADLIKDVMVVVRRLDQLGHKGQLAIARSMVRAALNVTGKQIKKDTDKKAKNAKKSVKARLKKGRSVFLVAAKVGFGVGPRNKKNASLPDRDKNRPGVGIGPNNIHWWVAGTDNRVTQAGNDRGEMPAMQPGLARIAYAQSAGNIKTEMIKRGALQLKKENIKLQKVK